MPDDIKPIIAEQRALAESRHQGYIDSPDREAFDDEPEVSFMTWLVHDYIARPSVRERLAPLVNAPLHELADRVRSIVERQLIESVWRSEGELVWSLAFAALRDVDWIELAKSVQFDLRQQDDLRRKMEASGFTVPYRSSEDVNPN